MTSYLRGFLHVVYWWSIWMGFVSTVVTLCILLDWFGHTGWNYPWYAGVMAFCLMGVALGIGMLAKRGLRTVGRTS
jgi:hypothetical protein